MLSKVIKAKYKSGVFEPLEPVHLSEDEIVDVTLPIPEAEDTFLASAGAWKELVSEEFIREVYEQRLRPGRPPVEL